MARDLGIPGGQPPPPATRATAPGWRDPRLWVGVVIVAASVLVGARVLGGADDTVAVWSVAADVGAGDQVGEDDLVSRRVRFADGGDLDRYFTVDDDLPADLRLLRPLGEGELLPRSAVGSTEETGTLEVSVEVEPGQVPTSVTSGSVVDLYLVAPREDAGSLPDPTGGQGAPPATGRPALSEVTVVDAPVVEAGFGTTGRRQLVLAVAEADVAEFYERLAGLDAPVISVVRRG